MANEKAVDREALKAFREKLDERYVIEGEYSPNTRVGNSDYADNLTPYSADSGVYQSIPFNFQGTGCGNGETQVDTGSYAYLKEKRGNGIVYNQLVSKSSIISDTDYGITATANTTTGKHTINGTATALAQVKLVTNISFISGHKYLLCANVPNVTSVTLGIDGANTRVGLQGGIITSTSNGVKNVRIYVTNGTVINQLVIKLIVIDLTKWFNGNIPQYLLDHPESFFRYYSGDLSYNTGEVRFSNARYLPTIRRNQWDEQATFSGTDLSSTNYTRVVPAETYYLYAPKDATISYYDSGKNLISTESVTHDTTFTTPNNCIFIKFEIATYGSSYSNNITISVYYNGESGYDKYYPYEILQTIDTGTEQLYSAGTAYDRKEPSGLITRNIGSVDLGSLSWNLSGLNFVSNIISDIKIPATTTTVANIICSLYNAVDIAKTFVELDFAINQEGKLYIRNTAYSDAATFKAAMSGVILYYELATPTTEQGTPFTENVKIDDFGSMSLESANGVPQGNIIFYPVDYKAYVDTLVNYTDGDATSLAKKSDIVQELPDAPSTNGNYRLRCTVADDVETYTWVAENANPIMHANIFRGKNLGTAVTNEQKTAIQNGTFEDLFVGDYWVINGITWRIADMDYFYQVGDTAFTKHHLVMIPDENLYSYVMNDSATTEGGYVGSKMYTTGLEQAKTAINSAFGSLVQTHRDYLINATIDGRPSGVAWFDSTVELMNEVMVYGCYIKTTMGTGVILPANHTTAKKQLSIFRLNPKMLNRRKYIWLRDVVSSFAFALVVFNGAANAAGANSSAGVRPYFVIG